MKRVRDERVGYLARLFAVAAFFLVSIALTARIIFALKYGQAIDLLSNEPLSPFIAVAYSLVGVLVTSRHPRNPLGWIFVSVGVLSVLQTLATAHLIYSPVFLDSTYPPGTNLAKWLSLWIWIPGTLLPIIFVFLLFPEGRLLSRRWQLVMLSATLGLGLMILAQAFHPGSSDGGSDLNPYGIIPAAGILEFISQAGAPLLAIGFLGSVAAFIVRVRRTRGSERQQMKWLIYAIGLMLATILLVVPLGIYWPDNRLVSELSIGLVSLAILGIAVAASIAILRYRLWDIDVVINRTLVYGALTASIVVIYVLIVGGIGNLVQVESSLFISLLATGLIAALFQPLRERVQHAVNRLFYGERDDPLLALSRLGGRLEAVVAPELLLPALVEMIAQTLRLPFVAISLRTGGQFKKVAHFGDEVEDAIHLPLRYQGETVGQLIAGSRSPGEVLSKADMRLLKNIAYQAGAGAHSVQLTAALQRSRQQLVTAREEERRRLRRDLHDGLGPVQASQGLRMAAVGQLFATDPTKAQELLEQLILQNAATVAEIRRLVYELRPPALDDIGLEGAVQDFALGLSDGIKDSYHLQVDVKATPDGLPSLPAAIEVAAYRIATEALTNVAHHARACHTTVSFKLLEAHDTAVLHVEIADDGVGLSLDHKSGIGLISMRERAEEIGGSFLIKSRDGQGTVVVADLPLAEVA